MKDGAFQEPVAQRRRRAGVTLIELAVVLAIGSALAASAVFGIAEWSRAQRVKTSARAVSDAFQLARTEAIRSGDNYVVVFGAGALPNADADIVVVDDGRPDVANCSIAASEIRHRVDLENGVTWGTDPDLAGTTPATGDPGLAVSNTQNGSSFTTAALDPNVPASWVVFQPDGIPRLFTTNGVTCTEIGLRGQGGGAIYVTNGDRDYAVVVSPLGTTRVHAWNPSNGNWTN